MKKLLFVIIGILIVGSLSAQNEYKYLMKLYGGIQIGLNGTGIGSTFVANPNSNIEVIDSIAKINGKIYFFIDGDTIPVGILDSDAGSLYDYASRKYLIDTALVTSATLTLTATHAGQVVRFSHATYQEVTIPANTIPVGSVITFIKTGAGPVRVNVGANVVRKSVLDSCTMNTVNQTYQILFRTTNKVEYIGNWVD